MRPVVGALSRARPRLTRAPGGFQVYGARTQPCPPAGWLAGPSPSEQPQRNGPATRDLTRALDPARMVNRGWGEPSSLLPERHDASDFELKTHDKAPAQ